VRQPITYPATMFWLAHLLWRLKFPRIRSRAPVEFYRDEIDNAERCFLACHEGRLAAIAWSYNHARKGTS
jgi:hypothetical protein